MATTGDPAPPVERPAGADCYATDVPLTVEEQRIGLPLPGDDRPASRRFVEAAGFEPMVDGFQRGLCGTGDLGAATAMARDAGAALWQAAVQRAQGVAVPGTIDRYDDRPLYWARVTMTRALREWLPAFELTSLQRQALVRLFTYASRGIDSVGYPEGDGVTRVLVSGFDTYSLDASLRNSNPSGASALSSSGPVASAAARRTTTAPSSTGRSRPPRCGRSRSPPRSGSRPRCPTRP
jgi:hypothetical protein